MSTLYEITGEYLALLDMAEDEDSQLFLDTMEGINAEVEVKAENYAIVMKEMEASISKYDEEIKRLTDRRNTLTNHIKQMKANILLAMTTMDKNEIKTDHFKLKICNNGGKQPMKITGDVPNNYQKIVLEPDTEKIRQDLEEGKELGFAVLEERGKHLRIS